MGLGPTGPPFHAALAAAAIVAATANISMATITILMMITKTMRETEMIPTTATMAEDDDS